jgi:hypothetical protein
VENRFLCALRFQLSTRHTGAFKIMAIMAIPAIYRNVSHGLERYRYGRVDYQLS